MAYVRSIPTEANSFLRSQRSTLAHYAAEAAVFDATAYIRHSLENGVDPTVLTNTGTINGWGWRREIVADTENPPGGEKSLRFYEVTAEAYRPGVPIGAGVPARTIRATMGEETFARYANFTDRSTVIYNISSPPVIEGHFHTNDYFTFRPYSSFYGTGGSLQAFVGYVTSAREYNISDPASDGVRYLGGFAPNEGGVINSSRYAKLYFGGRAGLNTGVDRIEMPTHTDSLKNRAWGEDVGHPAGNDGLYINADVTSTLKGGYYFLGDVNTMRLEALSGNAKITLTYGGAPPPAIGDPDYPNYPVPTDGPKVCEIYEVRTGAPITIGGKTAVPGQTLVYAPDPADTSATPAPVATVYNGHGNGVHYSTGSVMGLEGTNTGERTVAVDISTDQDIVMSGSLLRVDTVPAPANRPNSPDHVLGLVSHRFVISKHIPRSTSAPLYNYASFLAGHGGTFSSGGITFEDYADTSLGVGTYYQFGAAASGVSGPSGSTNASNVTISGYGMRQYYDKHLVNTPPPFFPTTGKLPIRSWREDDGTV